jgi:hypothetical protein
MPAKKPSMPGGAQRARATPADSKVRRAAPEKQGDTEPLEADPRALARPVGAQVAVPPDQRRANVIHLQRVLGNARTAGLLAPPAPGDAVSARVQREGEEGETETEKKPEKVDAKRADELVRKHFEADLPEATKKNAKAEGHVNIVGEAEFKGAYERVFGEIDDDYPYTNAFVDRSTDPPTVWGHKDRINPTTVLHEGMHFYSNLNWKNTTGFNANEGVTEYFTRQVVAKEKLPARTNYEDQFKEIEALVGVVGDDKMRAAYFNGDVEGVKKALDAAAGAGAFDRWVAAMKDSKWSDARKALTKAPEPAPTG